MALLDKNHTNILKGYALFAILFSHVGQFLSINAIELPGGIGVSLFLILSAYGITYSVEKNGLKILEKASNSSLFTLYFG